MSDQDFPNEPEIIVRLAEAIHPGKWKPWKNLGGDNRDQWLRYKRSAIAQAYNFLRALENPTPEMLVAGAAAISMIYETDNAKREAEDIYRAMIKHAWVR